MEAQRVKPRINGKNGKNGKMVRMVAVVILMLDQRLLRYGKIIGQRMGSLNGEVVGHGHGPSHLVRTFPPCSYHFVWEKVTCGEVRVSHVPFRHQIADIFTKGLPLLILEDFRDSLNIRQPPGSTVSVLEY
ncbi:hypothetical protein OROMI_011112 [Orobanche minor]